MNHQLIEDMQWRYACKKFNPEKKLTQDDLNILLETLRLTASSYGIQPWKFLVIKNQQKREKLVEAAFGQRQVADASDLIILCRPKDLDEGMIEAYLDNICNVRGQKKEELDGFKTMLLKVVDRPEDKKVVWAKNQIYIALGSLLTACAHLRIDSCPMEGFLPSKVDEILDLEALGLKSVLLCPVGYRADDDKYISIKKVRFPAEEVVRIIE